MIDYQAKRKQLKKSLTDCHNLALKIGIMRQETPDLEMEWEMDRFIEYSLRLRDLIQQTKDMDRAIEACLEWGLIYYRSQNDIKHRILWANSMVDLGLITEQQLKE